jgi:hypothetical protein
MTHLPKFVFGYFDVINLFNDRLSDLRLVLRSDRHHEEGGAQGGAMTVAKEP